MRSWNPERIFKRHVHEAARIWLREGFLNFKNSVKYDVIIKGKPYPPKAISSIAYKLATGESILSHEFAGAKEGIWHRRLKALEFQITDKDGMRLLTDMAVEEGYRQDQQASFLKRNRKIIEKVKIKQRFQCQACWFVLDVNGMKIIDCHHKFPLGQAACAQITTERDLICLCPTCHRIAHTRSNPLSIEEIRKFRSKISHKKINDKS